MWFKTTANTPWAAPLLEIQQRSKWFVFTVPTNKLANVWYHCFPVKATLCFGSWMLLLWSFRKCLVCISSNLIHDCIRLGEWKVNSEADTDEIGLQTKVMRYILQRFLWVSCIERQFLSSSGMVILKFKYFGYLRKIARVWKTRFVLWKS